ncbi:MAG TPA: hypothetical protein VGU45_17380 [Microvirga sp.]|jgi:hypothetical protein|nr:hypothetical protein [Microvirga sp.]
MKEVEVHITVLDYLDAAGGDQAEALRLAVEDLLKVQDEADVAVQALDQWTSRGYVQGKASERLGLLPRPR